MSNLNLLSKNAKLEKSIAEFGDEILTAGLFLAPHRRSGQNVCPKAGFCSAVCNLWFSGRTVTGTVRDAMTRRAKLYFDNPSEFFDLVYDDIAKLERKAYRNKRRLFVRMNGSSDLDFTRWADEFPSVEFYDYTKRPEFISRRLSGDWPANYSLCYSYSEKCDERLARRYLMNGGSVSMVFDTEYHPQSGKIGELPESAVIGRKRFEVIDGDKHDLRHPEYDEPGTIVGLRFKGSRKLLQNAIDAGFVRSVVTV